MSGIEHKLGDCKKMASREVLASHAIGIAGSAGGLGPLTVVLSQLPGRLRAGVVVVNHGGGFSRLVEILQRFASLRVKLAETGEPLCRSTVYIAPPGTHIILDPGGTIVLSTAPRLNFQRPSADWLFRSIAASYQRCATVVVLSGRLEDGARGVGFVRRAGGRVFVQDPQSCMHRSMPVAAIRTGYVDAVLAPHLIGQAVIDDLRGRRARRRKEWAEPFS